MLCLFVLWVFGGGGGVAYSWPNLVYLMSVIIPPQALPSPAPFPFSIPHPPYPFLALPTHQPSSFPSNPLFPHLSSLILLFVTIHSVAVILMPTAVEGLAL